MTSTTRPRVVVIGSGFGGLFVTKALADADVLASIAPAIAATSIQSLLLREVEAGLGVAGLVSMWASAQQTASILLTSPEGAVLRLIGL